MATVGIMYFSPKLTPILFLLAIVLWTAGLWAQAGNPQEEWARAVREGEQAAAEGKYADAVRALQKAVKKAEEFDSSDPRLASTLLLLADAQLARDDRTGAEKSLRRTLTLQEQQLGPESMAVANILLRLAKLHLSPPRRRVASMIVTTRQMVSVNSAGAVTPTGPIFLDSVSPLTPVGSFQPAYEKAEPLLRRALPIQENLLGKNHRDVGFTLNLLATAYRGRKNYPDAETTYQRALSIIQSVPGVTIMEIGSLLTNIANLYRDQKKFAQAEPYYAHAIAKLESAATDQTTQALLANVLDHYALFLRSADRKDEAKQAEQRSRALREQLRKSAP